MQIHKNTFEGGLNTNVNQSLVPANKYVEANNVNIAGVNNFFALENIKGSVSMAIIMANSVGAGISGVFKARFTVGTVENVDGLIIFSYTATTNTIWGYAGEIYKMYEETVDSTYTAASPMVNAVSYPENGLDILYFTDNIHELRKVRCQIPTSAMSAPGTAFLEEGDLKLLQRGANGTIVVNSVDGNGSLFCGSYQFAYQLVNPTKNLYTKWSLLSNPIQVYLGNATTSVKSGVGLQSNSSISLRITPSPEELDGQIIPLDDKIYTHFRLAVVENIEPAGISVQTAWLTKLELIDDFRTEVIPDVLLTSYMDYTFSTNTRIESIPLTDIVVDRLALETVKTLNIRENRLIGGNITYKDLSYDNGDPVISGGSIIKQDGGGGFDNLFVDAKNASKFRGYFRDEVYRFAISYFDEDGNFSYPKVFDLSTVTHNQITGAYKDMKFPSRSQNLGGTTYTLFSATGGIQSLGLQLNGIDNHPTWAKGFVILRANRLKNILFQTPVIPMMQHDSIGAVEKYPYSALELSGVTTKSVAYTEAQPMGPFTTYLPRNYFYLTAKYIYRNAAVSTGTTVNTTFTGEAVMAINNGFNSAAIFPPAFMFETQTVPFNPIHKLVTVDAALTKGKFTDFTGTNLGSSVRGKNIRTSVAGTYYALQDGQYYYNSTHNGAKAAITRTRTINAYDEFNNFNSGDVVGGKNFFNHDKFTTEGINWGQVGNTQKCSVVTLGDSVNELNYDSLLTFSAGAQIAHTSETTFYLTNDTLVHTIEIANMVSGLGDTRYGSYDTPHEFISTGAVYTFAANELDDVAAGTTLPVNISVWGGDCYVAPHLFKLTDTVYVTTNQGKHDGSATGEATSLDSVKNWERAFNDDTANQCAVSVPVPVKNAASFIEIVLESEYNPSVPDAEIVDILATDGTETIKIPIYGLNSNSESKCRVPLTYNINANHKKTNSDKVFRIKDPLLTDVSNLGSRIIYSDQKVYQTSIIGFDTFRVLNFKDLPESQGEITKLEVLSDDLYVFQENAISYIGIGERALETTDALTLAVQSGEFFGNILTVGTNVGSQHIGSVVNTGTAIYFIDNYRQNINRLAARQIQNISEDAIFSSLRDTLEGRRTNRELLSIYDPIFKQVWFVHNGIAGASPFCYVFDEARNMWVANYQFAQAALLGGAYSGGFLHIVGVNPSSNITVDQMYEGQRTVLLGVEVTPNVKFSINPQMEFGKTFDDILIPANDRLETIDLTVSREAALGSQTASGIVLDVTTRGEGNYRAKVLRDASGARLRGTRATANIKWKSGTGEVAVAVPSVLTKYRISDNRF